MADPKSYDAGSSSISSSSLMPAGHDTDSVAVRPRNRKGPGFNPTSAPVAGSSSLHVTPRGSPAPSRGVSPIPSPRIGDSKLLTSGRSTPNNAFSKGLLEGGWAPSWASVQDFASSLLSGVDESRSAPASGLNSRNGSKTRQRSLWKTLGSGSNGETNRSRSGSGTWGPEPPASKTRSRGRPTLDDIAAGTLAERDAALKAAKKASVLESYEGVNGGLDVTGKFKRRTSDEDLRESTSVEAQETEDYLVYIHHVKPSDTYAGIILRYRCQETAFRKANGLWSRDNIQVRKWLVIPVDSCEVRGRPCDPPSFYNNNKVDLLATTPDARQRLSPSQARDTHDDFFSSGLNGKSAEQTKSQEDEQPWTHVRWVKLDSVPDPLEIGRVSRRSLGYFPPRRKKSLHTVSTLSTPRHSLDLGQAVTFSSEATDSPGPAPSRRQSALSARPVVGSFGSSPSTRSRGNSLGGSDARPAWMRGPGGVGSMSRNVKAPGPNKDYLNTWVNRRLPKGFNIDQLPSMSVMGSETAHFGFANSNPRGDTTESSGIVESPYEDGRDALSGMLSTTKNGTGLEQAAAAVETWLRGAWARRPSTPRVASGSRHRLTSSMGDSNGDLIELADTNSDDGRTGLPSMGVPGRDYGLLGQALNQHGSTSRSDGEASVRGRTMGSGFTKGKKSD